MSASPITKTYKITQTWQYSEEITVKAKNKNVAKGMATAAKYCWDRVGDGKRISRVVEEVLK